MHQVSAMQQLVFELICVLSLVAVTAVLILYPLLTGCAPVT
jgi:hypothetical protein